MSFILDALKKSENERQRHNGPALADMPRRVARTQRPWWAIGLAALLVLNLLVFVIVLLRRPDEATANVTPAASPAAAPAIDPLPAPPPTVTAPLPATDPAVHSLAAEAGVPEESDVAVDPTLAAAASEVPEGPPMVTPIQGPTAQPAPLPATARSEVLPGYDDLTATGAGVPALHLDIHVYATRPADRFVFINMRKHTEGQTLAEGPHIERIDRDGVVLNHQGRRFILSRQ